MRVFVLLIFTLPFLVFNSCKKVDTGIEFGKEFTLKYHHTAILEDPQSGNSLEVKFEEVTEDSRCPDGVNCIWAGRVILEMEINRADKIYLDQTATGVEYGGYKFLLYEVNPYPSEEGVQIFKENYSSVLKVCLQ